MLTRPVFAKQMVCMVSFLVLNEYKHWSISLHKMKLLNRFMHEPVVQKDCLLTTWSSCASFLSLSHVTVACQIISRSILRTCILTIPGGNSYVHASVWVCVFWHVFCFSEPVSFLDADNLSVLSCLVNHRQVAGGKHVLGQMSLSWMAAFSMQQMPESVALNKSMHANAFLSVIVKCTPFKENTAVFSICVKWL